MITEVNGNLIDLFSEGKFDLIAHQANCFHTFGAGIARELRERYPEAYGADVLTAYGDIKKLGTFSTAITDSGIVLNIYGQYSIGKKAIETNYDALGVAFYKINHIYKDKHIGLPLIGCGIAGGDWQYVRYLIDSRLQDMQVTIVHFV